MYIEAADHEQKTRGLLRQPYVLFYYPHWHGLVQQILISVLTILELEVEPELGRLIHMKTEPIRLGLYVYECFVDCSVLLDDLSLE